MDGFYRDARDSNPSNLSCRPSCVVICGPDTLLPVSASSATPVPPLPSASSEKASAQDDSAVSPLTERPVTETRTAIDIPPRPRAVVGGVPQQQTASHVASIPPVDDQLTNNTRTPSESRDAARRASGSSAGSSMVTRVRPRSASMEVSGMVSHLI